MNKDVDFRDQPKGSYKDALNARVVNDADGTSISLNNIKGTKFQITIPSTPLIQRIDIAPGNNSSLTINTQENLIAVELYISDSKDLYLALEENKKNIEQDLGFSLEWMELQGKKASRIKLVREADLEKTEKWNEYFEWFKINAEKFQNVFGKYIKKIRK